MPVGDGHQGVSLRQWRAVGNFAFCAGLLRSGGEPVIGRVANLDEGEPVGCDDGEQARAHGLVTRGDELLDAQRAAPDGDGRADERADHRVAEGVGAHGRDERAVVRLSPGVLLQRAHRGGTLAGLAEGAEVAKAEEGIRRRVHGVEVERVAHREGVVAAPGVARGAPVGEPILVAAPDR